MQTVDILHQYSINDRKAKRRFTIDYRRGEDTIWAWTVQKTIWRERSVGSSTLGDTVRFFPFVLNQSDEITTLEFNWQLIKHSQNEIPQTC